MWLWGLLEQCQQDEGQDCCLGQSLWVCELLLGWEGAPAHGGGSSRGGSSELLWLSPMSQKQGCEILPVP